MSETGRIKIHGREYKTVALRVSEFREQCPAKDGWSIQTILIARTDDDVVVEARISNPDRHTVATGLAEEKRASSQINKTSALENCETSAIGRALAAFGIGGSEYASANEVQNAIHQQKAGAPLSDNDKKYIDDALDYIAGIPTVEDLENFYREKIVPRGNLIESKLRPACADRKKELTKGEQ